MIKGINYQVIEVTDCDNRYYERALLVVRPEHTSTQRELLEKEARKLLHKMDAVSTMKPKAVILSRILNAMLYSLIGAFVTILIYSLL